MSHSATATITIENELSDSPNPNPAFNVTLVSPPGPVFNAGGATVPPAGTIESMAMSTANNGGLYQSADGDNQLEGITTYNIPGDGRLVIFFSTKKVSLLKIGADDFPNKNIIKQARDNGQNIVSANIVVGGKVFSYTAQVKYAPPSPTGPIQAQVHLSCVAV